MHREVEDNTVIFTAFNRKLLRDLEELRNLLVRNKPEWIHYSRFYIWHIQD